MFFSCEYCEIFKNTYFDEHLRMAASTPSNVSMADIISKYTDNNLKNIALQDLHEWHFLFFSSFLLKKENIHDQKLDINFSCTDFLFPLKLYWHLVLEL